MTFLFTDVEGSTERWRRDEASMAAAMAAHDDTLRSVVADAGGVVFKRTGDGVVAAFASPAGAVDAAIAGQERLGLPVRMGVHTGEAELRDGDYFGTTLNRAARVMDAGHGGQVLLSAATAALVPDVPTTDLGVYSLKGLDASESIFQVGDQSFPELRVHRDMVGNLPGEVDAFVGRATEVIEVAELVGAHRIVTLIGVGGTGKTRLALRVADSVRWQFPDGCWLVDLAAVASVEAVPFAFARGLAIDAPDVGDVMEYVAAQVGRQRRLIVVDNCEHVLEAAGDVIEHLIEACPDAHVLATSREPVMVRGERLSAVPSMTSEDGFKLFLERAAAEAPGLELDEVQTQAAKELCERLDRLPLAIELVASRLRVQTPVELLAGVDERLRVLVGGRRSRMERHQT
ncbi:adenylate/guanylate cyclase domain-containing protein, partial [bacterium]|nr:adenylate/guanylate cyclase domain-containing protein [bacterium]